MAEPVRLAPVTINHVVFGVRYEPKFELIDHLGGIVDQILRAPDTPFGPKVFPNVDSNPNERRLINRENGDSLRLNSQDTILEFDIKSRDTRAVMTLSEAFETFVLRPMRKAGLLTGIGRYGMIVALTDAQKALKLRPIAKHLGAEFSNTNTLQMRFTRRLAVDEALTKNRVDDVHNVIYMITEHEAGQVEIAIDFQRIFKPRLDAGEMDDRRFSKFVVTGLDFIIEEFGKWLSAAPADADVA